MSEATAEQVKHSQELILDLLDLDNKARAEGHSLVEILVKAASTAWGINVRPDPRPAEEEPETNPAYLSAE